MRYFKVSATTIFLGSTIQWSSHSSMLMQSSTYRGEVVDIGHAEIDELRGQLLDNDLNNVSIAFIVDSENS